MTFLKGPNFQWWSQQFELENAVCHSAYAKEHLKMIFSLPKGKLRSPRGYHQYKIVMTLLKGPNFQRWSWQFALENAVCDSAYAIEDLKMIFSLPKGKLRSPRGYR